MTSPRVYLAIGVAKLASTASRVLRRGHGDMIGGHLALKIQPDLINRLSASKKSVIVTGTNGKSTTTRMIASALQNSGTVATQRSGANMDAGVATSLIEHPKAQYAAIEVDELYVPHIGEAIQPEVFVLLNLSRDQLDRFGELGAVEKTLREYIEDSGVHTIANCDDVLVTSAAYNSSSVTWVAAGTSWKYDSISCPRSGKPIVHENDDWHSSGDPDFRRQEPDWWYDQTHVYRKDGFSAPLPMKLPGKMNKGNAVMAIAAAVQLGADPTAAVEAVTKLEEISGRYKITDVDGHQVRLLLAKNPAGWHHAAELLQESHAETIIISVNGQVQDGQDLSWLWDVAFGRLTDVGYGREDSHQVVCCGERAWDLAVRLEYADINHRVETDILSVIKDSPCGRIDILANYTAFLEAEKILRPYPTIHPD